VNCWTMLIEEEIESVVHLFGLQGQHSENDLKDAGNLRHEPKACRGIFAGDLFQHIDFPGRSSAGSINTGAFVVTCPGSDFRNAGNLRKKSVTFARTNYVTSAYTCAWLVEVWSEVLFQEDALYTTGRRPRARV
jgi:hypothetical protein